MMPIRIGSFLGNIRFEAARHVFAANRGQGALRVVGPQPASRNYPLPVACEIKASIQRGPQSLEKRLSF